MISQKDLYDIALERQMYEDIKKLDGEETYYTLIHDVFSKDIELDVDFLWGLFLDTIQKKDFHLGRDLWKIERELPYPQIKFAEARSLINFFDNQIIAINLDIDEFINSSADNIRPLIKSLIIIKNYSLAIRRYPQSIDEEIHDAITSDSHWIKRAAKHLIYINNGSEYGDFSFHNWSYEKIVQQCSVDVNAFFMASICSNAFWVPITALLFDKLAETYKPNAALVEFINDFGNQIRRSFFRVEGN